MGSALYGSGCFDFGGNSSGSAGGRVVVVHVVG